MQQSSQQSLEAKLRESMAHLLHDLKSQGNGLYIKLHIIINNKENSDTSSVQRLWKAVEFLEEEYPALYGIIQTYRR